jgi:hypothetical protein
VSATLPACHFMTRTGHTSQRTETESGHQKADERERRKVQKRPEDLGASDVGRSSRGSRVGSPAIRDLSVSTPSHDL